MSERPRGALSCPLPLRSGSVGLQHGGGGRAMRELVETLFLPAFDPDGRGERHDSAVLPGSGHALAFTTDSYVVDPLFFPGGDIGSLAVFGTVNDLAMAGAEPRYLSAGFILEEGFALDALERVVRSMASAAERAKVRIVTGDTKVVDRGRGHGVYLNTAGVGIRPAHVDVRPARIAAGDAVLVSGDLGRHGVAVMSRRAGLEFETSIESDLAPLASAVSALVEAAVDLRCLRDLTRGGLGTALAELALDARVDIEIDEPRVAVLPAVRGACELFGLDPLYVANEGRMVVFVAEADATRALEALARIPETAGAARIGRVREPVSGPGRVTLRNDFGRSRPLPLGSGLELPRIC